MDEHLEKLYIDVLKHGFKIKNRLRGQEMAVIIGWDEGQGSGASVTYYILSQNEATKTQSSWNTVSRMRHKFAVNKR